jgi:hypothetical protein
MVVDLPESQTQGDQVKRRPENTPRKKRSQKGAARWSKAELDRLVEEATVDCHDESEQVSGLYTMLENDLALPFETEILGMAVTVEAIDLTDRDTIVAVCRRGDHRQKILLTDLPLPSPPPAGAQWIAAYRHWARAGGPSASEENDS